MKQAHLYNITNLCSTSSMQVSSDSLKANLFRMKNRIIYLVFLVVLLSSCEDFYTPDLEVVSPILVVESRMTNNSSNNFVKLTMTQDFYNNTETEKVTGATVELIQISGQKERGTEASTGYFTFKSNLVAGKRYYIRITNKGDIYESETVIMPPLPKIDSLYTNHKIVKTYSTDAYGTPTLIETPEREIYIDAPITPTLEYYRFDYHSVIQWMYNPVAVGPGPPPPSYFGWKTLYEYGQFNIAGPKEFSTSNKINKHPIRALAYDGRAYLDSSAQIPMGWILVLDQYGITKSSYDFHEKLNKQFSAEGSLFDPVLTQVYGNIHCKSDPAKTALGFFDLNSYRQYRYFLILGEGAEGHVTQRRLSRYPIITNEGFTRGTPPEFWELNY